MGITRKRVFWRSAGWGGDKAQNIKLPGLDCALDKALCNLQRRASTRQGFAFWGWGARKRGNQPANRAPCTGAASGCVDQCAHAPQAGCGTFDAVLKRPSKNS
ncbi:MAG: hypothetical protein LBP52_01575, partial [Burkholderiaceae bacterium]|nr:hypothetical protein [Burkholderiaceae bacterium]